MLLQRYYHALLGVSVFVAVTLCGELRNIKFGLRRLKERVPDPETTTSYKQRVLELERRQIPASSFEAFVSTSLDTGPVTDVCGRDEGFYEESFVLSISRLLQSLLPL